MCFSRVHVQWKAAINVAWENSPGNIKEIIVVLYVASNILLHSLKIKSALDLLLSVILRCYGKEQKSVLVALGFLCSSIS